ncbi:MAG TPA: hypothetical protein VK436_02445 [Methanocella sp.]|nr:hypothetical protein [Methanocella sp.]
MPTSGPAQTRNGLIILSIYLYHSIAYMDISYRPGQNMRCYSYHSF